MPKTEHAKQIQYRAAKLREKEGLSHEEALERARALAREEAQRLGITKSEKRIALQKGKRKRKFKATYTSNGRMPGRVLQGGAPGSGKKS